MHIIVQHIHDGMAQWKRTRPITWWSEDRNLLPSILSKININN